MAWLCPSGVYILSYMKLRCRFGPKSRLEFVAANITYVNQNMGTCRNGSKQPDKTVSPPKKTCDDKYIGARAKA